MEVHTLASALVYIEVERIIHPEPKVALPVEEHLEAVRSGVEQIGGYDARDLAPAFVPQALPNALCHTGNEGEHIVVRAHLYAHIEVFVQHAMVLHFDLDADGRGDAECAIGGLARCTHAEHTHLRSTRCLLRRPLGMIALRGIGVQVAAHDLIGGAVHAHLSFIQPNGAGTKTLYRDHVVAHEQDRATTVGHFAHATQALLLEFGIAYGKHFVHDQDLGIEVRGHGIAQAHLHAAAVSLDGRIQMVFNATERDDAIELGFDLLPAHAEDGAVEQDVLTAGEFRMEARAHFEQAAHLAPHAYGALRGQRDPREQFQQCAFARAIAAHYAHELAAVHGEGHIAQGPEVIAHFLLGGIGGGSIAFVRTSA